MLRSLLSGGALLALFISTAWAVEPIEFTPEAKVNLPKSSVDIAGLITGMTPTEAEAAIKKIDSSLKIETEEEWVGGDFNGARIRTTPYPAKISAERDGERIVLTFSTPASSNQLVAIDRSIFFWEHLEAPLFMKFPDDLKAKYGNPSVIDFDPHSRGSDGGPSGLQIIYAFKDGKVIQCKGTVLAKKNSACSSSLPHWDVGESFRLTPEFDVKVVFRLERHKSDDRKLGSVMTTLVDGARFQANSKADFDALIEFSKKAGPVKAKAPKL